MKIAAVLLIAAVGMGQTSSTPVPIGHRPASAEDRFQFMSGSNIIINNSPGPCGWAGTWDEGKGMCAINVVFYEKLHPITCSPVAADAEGVQRMICWYKPAPPTEQREK